MEQAQQKKIMSQINKALADDDMDTVIMLAKKIPMPPEVAKGLCVGFGAEALKSSGFNLSEANEKYGQDWLS